MELVVHKTDKGPKNNMCYDIICKNTYLGTGVKSKEGILTMDRYFSNQVFNTDKIPVWSLWRRRPEDKVPRKVKSFNNERKQF